MSLRVFSPPDCPDFETGLVLELDTREAHYLSRVRRASEGQEVEVLDGRGQAFLARILGLEEGGKRARVELLRPRPGGWNAPKRTLLLGVVDKKACLEALVDALVMGVSEIVWVNCARSQGSPPQGSRLARATRAAQRQCGRADRPVIIEAPSLESALALDAKSPLVWASLADPQGSPGSVEASLPTRPHLNAALRLAIGPEGGFDPAEVALLRAHDAYPLRIAPWVLRAERAVLAALAKLFPETGQDPRA